MSPETPRHRQHIKDVRRPEVSGLSNDISHMLHRSLVEIRRMRRSIESSGTHIDASREAINDSWHVLKRAQDGGF
jgi:hypothetical protein